MTYWLKPNCTVHSQVAGLQGNLYIRKKTGGVAESFPVGASYLWNKLPVLVNDSDSTVFKSTLKNWNSAQLATCNLQPALYFLLLQSVLVLLADWMWLVDMLLCVCGHTQAVIYCTHPQSQSHTLSLCLPLMQISSGCLCFFCISWCCIHINISIAFQTLMML